MGFGVQTRETIAPASLEGAHGVRNLAKLAFASVFGVVDSVRSQVFDTETSFKVQKSLAHKHPWQTHKIKTHIRIKTAIFLLSDLKYQFGKHQIPTPTTRQWMVSNGHLYQRVPLELIKMPTQKHFLFAFALLILLYLAHRRLLAQARATSMATRAASLSPRRP